VIPQTNTRTGYYIYMAAGLLLFFLVVGRLFHLQVVKGDYYQGLSNRNHIRVVVKPAPRGLILDRNGVVLADSRPAFTVSVVPSEFDDSMTDLTASLLGITGESLVKILDEASSVPHRPVVVREGIGVGRVSPIAEEMYRIPGVLIDVAPLRRYRKPDEFCHILGYVGLSGDPDSYRGEVTGKMGIEKSMDNILRGVPGLHREVVDAVGRVVDEYREAESQEPVPGKTVILTMDAVLQDIADSTLEKTGCAGSVVVLDYESGEVLCAVSKPGFDPNVFARGITTGEWKNLMEDPGKPLFCRSWTASYPPASTFKLVTAYWLLREGYIDENTMPNPCYGSLELGDTRFGCWTIHGRLNVVGAIAQSCDIFFYRTCQYGDVDGLADYARMFGLGRTLTCGIPEESPGLVPDSRYLNDRYGSGGWGLGNLLNLSIGQGELLATPLQMAVIAGIVASGGAMPEPTVVAGCGTGKPVMNPRFVDSEAFDVITRGMLQAVRSPSGTLHGAFDGFEYDFLGKTGTAECTGKNHAIVVGFSRDPLPLAICVFLEHGGYGGASAGPVARGVLEEYFERMDPR